MVSVEVIGVIIIAEDAALGLEVVNHNGEFAAVCDHFKGNGQRSPVCTASIENRFSDKAIGKIVISEDGRVSALSHLYRSRLVDGTDRDSIASIDKLLTRSDPVVSTGAF